MTKVSVSWSQLATLNEYGSGPPCLVISVVFSPMKGLPVNPPLKTIVIVSPDEMGLPYLKPRYCYVDDAFNEAILKFVTTASFSVDDTVSICLASDQSSVIAEMLYWSVKFRCCATIPSVGPRKPVSCNVVPVSVND